jgi:hypothetical protein
MKFSAQLQAQVMGACIRSGLSTTEAIDALLSFAAAGHQAEVELGVAKQTWESRVERAFRSLNGADNDD